MLVHIQPVVYTVRLYPEGGGYPGPFIGVATVQLIGPHTAYIGAMHGNFTRKHMREIATAFKALGVKFVLAQRHGKIKQHNIEEYMR